MFAPSLPPFDTLLIKVTGGASRVVSVANIAAVIADENYCRLALADGSELRVRGTLQSWGAALDAQRFLRVHRTAIVNLAAVTAIAPRDRLVLLVSVRGVAEPLKARRALRGELERRVAEIVQGA